MDSAVCLALSVKEGYETAAFHLNYRQITEKKEFESFELLTAHYRIKEKIVLSTDALFNIGGSALFRGGTVGKTDYQGILKRDPKDIPPTYVPFRNGIILSLAAAWAEKLGASVIFIGVAAIDFSGYPDCGPKFIKSFSAALSTGTKNGITVEAPLLKLSKQEIVKKGIGLKVPFEMTWSCYKNEDRPCGECESCILRAKGFTLAGERDPLISG